MNKLDKDYLALCQDILDNGTKKQTRTGTDAISIFGRQICHKMSDGFPLLTTKKMAWKQIVTELLWFLRGDTHIKFLHDNDCHIWDGDAYKNYEKWWKSYSPGGAPIPLSREMFIDRIKTDDEFAKRWGDLGPIYPKQWRSWREGEYTTPLGLDGPSVWKEGIDQIANLINDLKTNPDSRRLMVSAWNVGELDQMVLPPCHYGFQVYTREMSFEERIVWMKDNSPTREVILPQSLGPEFSMDEFFEPYGVPKRAISLMWNQRSVDVPLGLPFNIASYGLLLEIIAKAVNMIPETLIGNLGDCHIYENQIDGIKEQMGRELSWEERVRYYETSLGRLHFIPPSPDALDARNIPKRTREPYPLPSLNINTEFWPTENGSCGEGPLDAIAVFNAFKDDNFCKCLLNEDIQLDDYRSHPAIKIPLSN